MQWSSPARTIFPCLHTRFGREAIRRPFCHFFPPLVIESPAHFKIPKFPMKCGVWPFASISPVWAILCPFSRINAFYSWSSHSSAKSRRRERSPRTKLRVDAMYSRSQIVSKHANKNAERAERVNFAKSQWKRGSNLSLETKCQTQNNGNFKEFCGMREAYWLNMTMVFGLGVTVTEWEYTAWYGNPTNLADLFGGSRGLLTFM